MLVIACTSTRVRAETRIPLEFTAPAACPDRGYILHAIDALLSESSAETIVQLDHVSAEIRAEGPQAFGLRVSWSGAASSGNRYLAAESCQVAADTAAWLIALALRPDLDDPSATEPQGQALRYELGVGAGVDTALLPALGWALAARAGLALQHVHLTVSAAYLPDQTAQLGTARAELSLLELGLTGCYLATLEAWNLGPCARAALGRMAATVTTASAPRSGSARTHAFGLGLEARRRLSDSLVIFAELDAMWRQRRPVFVLADVGTLHRPGSVGLHAVLGLTITFP